MMGKVVNSRVERYDVYIGRPSKWGNPFKLINADDDQERAEVLDEYRVWLWNEIRRGRWTVRELSELADRRLGCFCAPKPCHGDALLRAAQFAQTVEAASLSFEQYFALGKREE